MRCSNVHLKGLIVGIAVASAIVTPGAAAPKKDFEVAWSIYVGWMPWGWAMDRVRRFLFDKHLLGNNAASPDAVGIELADRKVLGDANDVKFRFTDNFMAAAVAGKF